MADMEGFKEAAAYGLDKPQKSEQFFLKGNENQGWGVKNRLARIFNPKTGHTVTHSYPSDFSSFKTFHNLFSIKYPSNLILFLLIYLILFSRAASSYAEVSPP